MTGATLARVTQNRADLRFPFPERFAERLEGRRIDAVGRRAKYLMIDLDDGSVLASHLGMTGSFRVERPSDRHRRAGGVHPSSGPSDHLLPQGEKGCFPGAPYYARGLAGPHDHVRFECEGGLVVTYNDPRRFGFMVLLRRGEVDVHPLFRDIGVEPLGEAFDAGVLARLMAGRAAPLKAALLDQKLIAGLGNIYVCEALHRAGLSPRRRAGSIVLKTGAPSARAVRLAEAIRQVLTEAVEAGGSTLRDYRHADGSLGTFQHGFRAYDREHQVCASANCRGRVQRIVQSGRSTFFCAGCQR